jgi:hypothetical protein
MDDLVRWLTACLDEDKRIARAASAAPWTAKGVGDFGWAVHFSRPDGGLETEDSEQGLADTVFIAEWDPARVLREIESKRTILRELPVKDWHEPCASLVRVVLKQLALPYADRPGSAEATASVE